MNSFDLMIEKYSKELIEAGKKSMASAVEEDNGYINTIDTEEFIKSDKEPNVNESSAVVNVNNNISDNNFSVGSGRLKIQTYAADGVYPVVAANVKIFKNGEDELYFEGYTDGSGISDNIVLPAPSGIDTDMPSETEPYYEYDIVITHPKFIQKKYKNVPVFDNISSIQTVQLVPISYGSDEESEITESENENLMKR